MILNPQHPKQQQQRQCQTFPVATTKKPRKKRMAGSRVTVSHLLLVSALFVVLHPCQAFVPRIIQSVQSSMYITTHKDEDTATDATAILDVSTAKPFLHDTTDRHDDVLYSLLDETLTRMAFLMETNDWWQYNNDNDDDDDDDDDHDGSFPSNLQHFMTTCWTSVRVGPSTIVKAGRGVFATTHIPRGTVVSLYPVHAVGVQLPSSGECRSVQRTATAVTTTTSDTLSSSSSDHIDYNTCESSGPWDMEASVYNLVSIAEEPQLCGIDLADICSAVTVDDHNDDDTDVVSTPRLMVDVDPHAPLRPGWAAHLINDSATLVMATVASKDKENQQQQYHNDDLTYYPRSCQGQNVELLPLSSQTPLLHVAMTTKDVQAGEELFVSYGYSYWKNRWLWEQQQQEQQHQQPGHDGTDTTTDTAVPPQTPFKPEAVIEQEMIRIQELNDARELLAQNYGAMVEEMAELFDGMGGGIWDDDAVAAAEQAAAAHKDGMGASHDTSTVAFFKRLRAVKTMERAWKRIRGKFVPALTSLRHIGRRRKRQL